MARCCAVITGDGITGNLMLHQAQEEAPTTIDGVIKGLTPVSVFHFLKRSKIIIYYIIYALIG